MRKILFAACVVAAVAVGWFVGRAGRADAGRGDSRTDIESYGGSRRVVRLPADELIDLRRRVERSDQLETEVRRLRERVAKLEPDAAAAAGEGEGEESLPVGTRRPDGTIVGGARWSPMTQNMALGFLDSMVSQFFAEVDLTEDQERRLRAEMQRRISDVMQITADYINDDITADQAYAFFEAIAVDSRKVVAGVIDPRQLEVYHRFEGQVGAFVHGNVVNTEMATLRQALDLDAEQEKRIRPLVAKRYDLVEARLGAPIPNMFFRPLRREMDRDIYEQTGTAIRQLLSPEQAAAFDKAEQSAATALQEYRSLLVPKSP